jgi:hypothetical protein
MATNCRNCGCSKISCGCGDSFLTTPPPCPTPEDCPTAQPCSEVFDAQCVAYTGLDIECGTDVVITTNDSVATALQNVVDYFCNAVEVNGYQYINSFFATNDTFITNTSWHVPTNFVGFAFTAALTGKYKVTLTAECSDEDPNSAADIGLGINTVDPVGTSTSNPFIIKEFRGSYNVQTHTYIIDLGAGDIMRLKFKSIGGASMNIDPLYMTVEKIAN